MYVDFILSAHNSAVHNLCHDTTDTQTKMYIYIFFAIGSKEKSNYNYILKKAYSTITNLYEFKS